MNTYRTPLLMSNGPGRLIHVSSLNSFWGWNSSFLVPLPKMINDATMSST